MVEGDSGRKNHRPASSEGASWTQSQFPDSPDRETFQDVGEEVWKGCETQREEGTEMKEMKEEKHRQREAAARRPHCVVKKAFESPKTTDSGYGGRIGAKSGGGGEGGRADGQPPLKLRRRDKTLGRRRTG